MVDGVDCNAFFELVVFVVVMMWWWWWSSCGGDGCFKGGYPNCCRIAILKCILGGCGCGASGCGRVVVVVGVAVMVYCWRWCWPSSGVIEVVSTVITAFVWMAVVLVVRVP